MPATVVYEVCLDDNARYSAFFTVVATHDLDGESAPIEAVYITSGNPGFEDTDIGPCSAYLRAPTEHTLECPPTLQPPGCARFSVRLQALETRLEAPVTVATSVYIEPLQPGNNRPLQSVEFIF